MYVYKGDPGRYYPDAGVEANPGDLAEQAPADDGRWFPVDDTTPAPAAPEPEPDTPASEAPSTTAADVPVKDES